MRIKGYMSHSLNSFNGVSTGDHVGDYYGGVFRGNSRSLGYSSHEVLVIVSKAGGD